MLNKNNAESSAVEPLGMIELNEQELAGISGGWGGWGDYDDDFDDGYGSRRSFEKIVVIKRRSSRRHFDYDDYDD
ncbi:hypothetical protein [Dictyobacter halimunensis]